MALPSTAQPECYSHPLVVHFGQVALEPGEAAAVAFLVPGEVAPVDMAPFRWPVVEALFLAGSLDRRDAVVDIQWVTSLAPWGLEPCTWRHARSYRLDDLQTLARHLVPQPMERTGRRAWP